MMFRFGHEIEYAHQCFKCAQDFLKLDMGCRYELFIGRQLRFTTMMPADLNSLACGFAETCSGRAYWTGSAILTSGLPLLCCREQRGRFHSRRHTQSQPREGPGRYSNHLLRLPRLFSI
jgi:hypothetical protein